MANPLDTDAGSEMFSSYEAELKLVQADLNQKLDQIAEASGEERKAAIKQAERVLDEANELVRYPLSIASSVRALYVPTNECHSSTKCAWRSKTSLLPPDRKSTFAFATTPQISIT